MGAGSLVRALAPALQQAGYRIDEILVRQRPESRRRAAALARRLGARVATLDRAKLASDVLWLGVNDSAIADCARRVAGRRDRWDGRYALHSSGALTSEVLAPLAARGAAVASLHPMMTFVRRGAPPLAGVGFAAEGDRRALRLAKAMVADLGGHWFRIAREAKPLYHAWGAFICPWLIVELAQGERVAQAVGIRPAILRRIMEPIVRRTIDNYFQHGAAAAFSGPLVRGDVATVAQHLQELKRVPGARDLYRALAQSALATLPVGERQAMARLLGE